ncbi:MAG: CHAT domain-containing protein [Kamptonema sp. SIO4C4]|nr:CHAT domain-containing protein [Kamptonema sp. SIO4C4]
MSTPDEYVGLVSAFLQTGVTYVLSTLWQVESFVTSLFMVQFYETLQQGKPPILALYETQQWLKTATPPTLSHCLDTSLNTLTTPSLRKRLENRRNKLATLEPTTPPYANPYYWAAFIIAGYEYPHHPQSPG